MTLESKYKQTYYEVLSISHDATTADVIDAYGKLKLIFQPESLATYSLYSEDELKHLREKIEDAYQTLSDKHKRFEYDAEVNPSQIASPKEKLESIDKPEKTQLQPSKPINKITMPDSFKQISGKALKDIRKSQNISLKSIASQTKVSLEYLEAIESENKATFPAPFYFKSFLKQYATAIGLDPELVVKTYIPLQSENPEQPKK